MQTQEGTTKLRSAFESARPHLEAGLAAAEEELRHVDARRQELLDLIARARFALGEPERPRAAAPRMTLHDAIAQVLYEEGNPWLTAREIAERINTERLYEKRDGSGVDVSHIHARAKQYAAMFEKDGARVRLRAGD